MTVWVLVYSWSSWEERVTVYPTRAAAEDAVRETAEDNTCACDGFDLVASSFEELCAHVQEQHGDTVNLHEVVMRGPFPRPSGSLDVAILEVVAAEYDIRRAASALRVTRNAMKCEVLDSEGVACWHVTADPDDAWCATCVARHAVHTAITKMRHQAGNQRRRVAALMRRRAHGETEIKRTRKRKPAPLGVRGIVLRDREDGHEQRADGGDRERGGAVHLHRRARRTGE